MKPRFFCIIPARMNSTRFPGKPLASLLGIPLVHHVALRCQLSELVKKNVYVATCDQVIMDSCQHANLKAIMTANTHERCTDRVEEAINKLPEDINQSDYVLMVQGDEVLVEPSLIDLLAQTLIDSGEDVVNMVSPIESLEEFNDRNVVKTLVSKDNHALAFSRSPIPFHHTRPFKSAWQQMGVIGFKVDFLKAFSKLPPTPLEVLESIDMMRVLEHGKKIPIVKTSKHTIGVDTPEELIAAEKILKQDSVTRKYISGNK